MLKKPKILVVGSFVMDLIASTKRVPNSGETVIGLKFNTAPGGKGINQAVQCARLGADVTMVGRVGDDAFGRIMTQTAKDSGVDVSYVGIDIEESSGVGHITLEVKENSTQNRITVCPGANHKITVEDVRWLEKEIAAYDIVMMQFEIPMEVNIAVAQWAKQAGVPVMVNPAPSAPIPDELMACITYLSPNEHEAAAISGHPIDVQNGVNEDDIRAVAEIFRSKGTECLIITLGENGSALADKDGLVRVPCVRMPYVADPTAAGDSFVAAFCTGVTAGLSKRNALSFAAYTAAITVSRMGAMPSLPTTAEVRLLMEDREYQGFDLALLDALK